MGTPGSVGGHVAGQHGPRDVEAHDEVRAARPGREGDLPAHGFERREKREGLDTVVIGFGPSMLGPERLGSVVERLRCGLLGCPSR